MEIGNHFDSLRRSILAISPVHEKSLTSFLDLFSSQTYPKDSFFIQSGAYPLNMAYICKGGFVSYYQEAKTTPHIEDIFIEHNFLLPVPPSVHRSPTYLNVQAIASVEVLQAKYSAIDALTQKNPTIDLFMRALINRELIVRKAVHESSPFVYNLQTRYQLLEERLGTHISIIPPSYIASYLNITEKQLSKLQSKAAL